MVFSWLIFVPAIIFNSGDAMRSVQTKIDDEFADELVKEEPYKLQNYVQIFSVRKLNTDFPLIKRDYVLELQTLAERGVVERGMKYDRTSGNLYTLSDFIAQYGRGSAKEKWDSAMEAPQAWRDKKFGVGWAYTGNLFDESTGSLGYKWEAQQNFIKGEPGPSSIRLNMNQGKEHSWRMWDTMRGEELMCTMNRYGKEWRVYQGRKRSGILLYVAKIKVRYGDKSIYQRDKFQLKIFHGTTNELAAVYQPVVSLDEWPDLMKDASGKTSSQDAINMASRKTKYPMDRYSQYLIVKPGEDGAMLSALALVSHVQWLRETEKLEYGFDKRRALIPFKNRRDELERRKKEAEEAAFEAAKPKEYTAREIEENQRNAMQQLPPPLPKRTGKIQFFPFNRGSVNKKEKDEENYYNHSFPDSKSYCA